MQCFEQAAIRRISQQILDQLGCRNFSRNTLFKTLNLLVFYGFEGKSVQNSRFRAQIL